VKKLLCKPENNKLCVNYMIM